MYDETGCDPHICSLLMIIISVSLHQEGGKTYHHGIHVPDWGLQQESDSL